MTPAERKKQQARERTRRWRARKGLMRLEIFVDPAEVGDLLRDGGHMQELDDFPQPMARGVEKLIGDICVMRHVMNLDDLARLILGKDHD